MGMNHDEPTGGTIPVDHTPIGLIHQTLNDIEALHPPATFTGDRVRQLTRRIRDAANQIERETQIAHELLNDHDEDTQEIL